MRRIRVLRGFQSEIELPGEEALGRLCRGSLCDVGARGGGGFGLDGLGESHGRGIVVAIFVVDPGGRLDAGGGSGGGGEVEEDSDLVGEIGVGGESSECECHSL